MRRTLRPLAALAMVALLSAGCSNAAAGTGTGSSGGSNTAATAPAQTGIGSGGGSTAATREQAVKFAECMRAHGVSAFPDPDASGELTIDAVANGSSVDTSSAAFKQALSACKDLEPAGFTGTKVTLEQRGARLEFAQCIRDNGVKDFPDPTPDGPLVDTSRMPGSPGARSIPGLQPAMEKCSAIYSGELGLKGQ